MSDREIVPRVLPGDEGAGAGPGEVVVFDGGGGLVAAWPMAAGVPVDVALIEGLCRLRQLAMRMGWSVALHDPRVDLCEVLEFVGLADVVPMVDADGPIDWVGSVVEVVRQSEQGEQLG
jgi:hypothetical protein